MKNNKVHNGKEFKSYFHFVGKIHKYVKGFGDQAETKEFLEVGTTRTGKARKVLQFDLETAKNNNLKVELNGMEFPQANVYSSTHKKNYKIAWEDRNNKDKYPDDTYHLIAPDWDKIDEFSEKVSEGAWVEVKGKYEFSKFTTDDGKDIIHVKRMINSIELVEDGQEIKVGDGEIIYTTDFDADNFIEVNRFGLEIGIRSTYQDEKTKDTKVNAVFLDYGKERSTPKEVELMAYYQESEKTPLADAFAKLNRLDVVEVFGVDNNRPEFSEVQVESKVEDDPFADVDEVEVKTERQISGNKKGLEIQGVVAGTYLKGLLTEEEITPVVQVANDNPFDSKPKQQEDRDPFADDGKPIDISESELPF